MTGSSPGTPRVVAAVAIQAAIALEPAPSPG